MRKLTFVVGFLCLLVWQSPAQAQYVILLKNGRQITVQSYRDEGSMVKFSGYGGEIGIDRSQIQTIRNLGIEAGKGLDTTAPEPHRPAATPERTSETVRQPAAPERPTSAEDDRAREEREYHQKLIQITEQIKSAQDKYSLAIRGTTGSEPTLLTSEEQLKARTDDVISRSLDAQYNPSKPTSTKILTPSPFTSLPPTVTEVPAQQAPRPANLPTYTERQKELSELRSHIIQLETARENIIEEMKKKNFGLLTVP